MVNKKELCLSNIIEKLNIRVMYCRSGNGLMSYGYNFIQIGGIKGQSNDDVKREDIWDGNYKISNVVVDCRGLKCKKISKNKLKEIIEKELE